MVLSIEHLYDFLSRQDPVPSLNLMFQEEESSQPIPWEAQEFFPLWNGLSCLSVVCYVLNVCSESEHSDVLDAITKLDDLAAAYNAKPERVRVFIESVLRNTGEVPEESGNGNLKVVFPDPPAVPPTGSILDPIAHSSLMPVYVNSLRIRREIGYTFVNIFWPKVKQFFTFSKRNGNLQGYIHFLLQILNSEPRHIPRGQPDTDFHSELQNNLLEWLILSLNMFLVVLGDTPFQLTDLEQVKNVLTEFEDVANGAGSLIYSYFFRTGPVNFLQYMEDVHPVTFKAILLIAKIEEHCSDISELLLTTNANPRNASAFDALFIVESLLEDLHQIFMTGRINAMFEEMIQQTITLREELYAAQSFLKDTNVPQDGEFKEVKIQLRETAYEARYLMSSFLVEDIPVLYLLLRLPVIIQKLQLIRKGFTKIRTMSSMKVPQVQENLTVDVPSQKMVVIPEVTNDNFAMGSEDEMVQILDELTGDSHGLTLKFICIYGMPGLGKTMLAKRLYNHPLITERFGHCGWCVVSKTYQKRTVLIDILLSLRNTLEKDTISEMENESLALEIYRTLCGRRYVIVFDDVWDWTSLWDDLGTCFPKEREGSRILLTTRNIDTVPTNSLFHTPSFLSKDQCWELLERKVFFDEPCPPQLQDSGKRIAEKCNGLPLAVVVIAGALANMPKEKRIWDKAEGSLDTYASDCMEILELSYNYLPDHLKLCFLYFGVFHEDAVIPRKKLIQLWIIEGFIRKDERKSQEIVAEEYLKALVDRSLVFVARYNKSTGEAKGYSIHDLLRDMCIRLGTEENFLSFAKTGHGSTQEKHQRLCVPPTAPVHVRPFSLHCRSVFGHLSDPSSCLPQMKRLKVMELAPRRPSLRHVDIFKRTLLLQLRYLVIDQTIPEPVLINLVNLEFLCINNKSDIDVSKILSKLVRLRHLHIMYTIFNTDCNTSQPNNLQSLSNIHMWDTEKYENLRSLPRLQKLKCHCVPLLPDLRFLTELESLSIAVTYFPNEISTYNQTINLPLTIKKLTLSHARLPWESMSLLGKLPQLESLKLLLDAFEGTEWTTSDDGFKNLRFLKLGYLDIEQWISESRHFPQLSHLVLVSCNKLQMLPKELGDSDTLQTIEVHDCSYEASISAIQVEQEQLYTGNPDLQVIIVDGRWSKQQLVLKYKEKEEEKLGETQSPHSSGTGKRFWWESEVQCDYCGILPIVGDRYKCKVCTEKMGYNICRDCYTSIRSKPPCRGYNQNHTYSHEFKFVTSTGESHVITLPRRILRQMDRHQVNRLSIYRFVYNTLLGLVLGSLGLGWFSRFL